MIAPDSPNSLLLNGKPEKATEVMLSATAMRASHVALHAEGPGVLQRRCVALKSMSRALYMQR